MYWTTVAHLELMTLTHHIRCVAGPFEGPVFEKAVNDICQQL